MNSFATVTAGGGHIFKWAAMDDTKNKQEADREPCKVQRLKATS